MINQQVRSKQIDTGVQILSSSRALDLTRRSTRTCSRYCFRICGHQPSGMSEFVRHLWRYKASAEVMGEEVVDAPYLQNRNLLGRYRPHRSAALGAVWVMVRCMHGYEIGLTAHAASLAGCKMPNKLLWIVDRGDAAQTCFQPARGTGQSSRKREMDSMNHMPCFSTSLPRTDQRHSPVENLAGR